MPCGGSADRGDSTRVSQRLHQLVSWYIHVSAYIRIRIFSLAFSLVRTYPWRPTMPGLPPSFPDFSFGRVINPCERPAVIHLVDTRPTSKLETHCSSSSIDADGTSQRPRFFSMTTDIRRNEGVCGLHRCQLTVQRERDGDVRRAYQ